MEKLVQLLKATKHILVSCPGFPYAKWDKVLVNEAIEGDGLSQNRTSQNVKTEFRIEA
jgi:hypothetical protein